MSELTKVKDAITDILNCYRRGDENREDLYADIQDDVCIRGICGGMDCCFCPLETLESFVKEYGNRI